MKFLAVLAAAGAVMVMPKPALADAQVQVPAECAQAFKSLEDQASVLLDSAIHSEADYDKVHADVFAPAVTNALAACRASGEAKHAIYELQSRLSTYQDTRDAALRILESKPPTPTN